MSTAYYRNISITQQLGLSLDLTTGPATKRPMGTRQGFSPPGKQRKKEKIGKGGGGGEFCFKFRHVRGID